MVETTCRQLFKRLPYLSTSFATEATAITLALDYYRHIDPVQHRIVDYSDALSCLQAVESEKNENPLICHIMNLLWALSDKGTRVCFCWAPSLCGIEGNEMADQLVKETFDHDIEPLATVHCRFEATGKLLYPKGGSNEVGCICTSYRSIFLKSTLEPPKKFQCYSKVVMNTTQLIHWEHVLGWFPRLA